MEKESLGVAWSRFSLLVRSGPNLSITEPVLLQHFYLGLDKESAIHLDLPAEGSFIYLTPSEGVKILDRILENTSFVESVTEPPSPEPVSPSIEHPIDEPTTSLP